MVCHHEQYERSYEDPGFARAHCTRCHHAWVEVDISSGLELCEPTPEWGLATLEPSFRVP